MKPITNFSLFLLLILPFISMAQNQKNKKALDSIINVVNSMPDDTLKVAGYGTLFEKLQFNNPDLAFSYSKKALNLSKKLGYKKGVAGSNFQFADFHRSKGNIDSARFYYDASAKLAKDANSLITRMFINHSRGDFEKSLGNYEEAIAYINKNIEIYNQTDTIYKVQGGSSNGATFNLIGAEYELIGSIHKEMGNYKIALSETLKALHFFEQKRDTLRQADALMQLGSIEGILKNYKSAILHGKRAYKIYELYHDEQYKAYAANNIGANYLVLKQPADAVPYFKEALEISKGIESKEIEAQALSNLSNAYFGLDQFQKSESFLIDGLKLYKNLDYKKEISSSLNQFARLARENKKYSKGIEYVNESILIASKIGAKNNLSEAYSLRSAINKNLTNYKSALEDYELFKSTNDSIFNTTKSQQIEELRTIYDTEKKEQQIALQENEISLLEQKEKISSLQKMLLGTGLGLSLLVFGFGFYGIRQKMQRNKLEKEKVDVELDFKKKELTTHAMHLAKKNEVLEHVKQKAKELKTLENGGRGYQQLIQTINFDQQDDKNWENFTQYFEQVHKDFSKIVKNKYPEITKNELRLMALLKMNLSSKEIATILNISSDGIKKARQRLRKKMGLSPEESLEATVLTI